MSQKRIIVGLEENGEEDIIIESDRPYSKLELEEMADQILRAHAKSIDPKTGKPYGPPTTWDEPVLLEEHLYSRRRREIYNQNGVPDPSIASGNYWRSHPQGRKVNSPEQRKRNGASYYR
jgi:hypothetical protein